jgi:SAM-dependent methyltransferase
MIVEESEWIGKELLNLSEENKIHCLINIGSSTGHFRNVIQPHINNNIFKPLTERKVKVIHLDLKESEGVDLVGDIMDPEFFNVMKNYPIDCYLCSNTLEHVSDPKALTVRISEVASKGSYLLITVPYIYPYCNDPMDNLLRPTVEELSAMFPGTKLIKGEIVEGSTNFLEMIKKNKRLFLITFLRLFMPFYKSQSWAFIWKDYFKMKKNISVTCVLLQKL